MKLKTIRIIFVTFLYQLFQILIVQGIAVSAANSQDISDSFSPKVAALQNETILSDCQADFYYLELPGMSASLAFFDASIPEMSTWFWDFGEGGYSTEQNPVYTFPQSGYYTVCLTIADSASGCLDTECKEVFVPGGGDCQAGFEYFFDFMIPLQVHFLDASFGNITNWFWDFGDGFTSGEINPVHIYDQTGTYEVCLTILDSLGGCVSVFCENVVVENQFPCNALFAWQELGPGHVQFLDMSVGQMITSWNWDFGDGNYSSEQSPEHFFEAPGEYLVCLSISDNEGFCEDTYCESVFVTMQPPDCHADFTFNIQPANHLNVEFYDLSTGDPILWFWDFGDGNFSSDQNPEHEYAEGGIYLVCLMIQDSSGFCQDTLCKPVEVTNDTLCQADFSYEVSLINPLEVQFFDQSSGGIAIWEWDFGDGNFSSDQNPSHQYSFSGSYNVCLTVIEAPGGCSDFFCDEIVIVAPELCEADFNFELPPDQPLLVQFADISQGMPNQWFWDFGDGAFSSEQNPAHFYSDTGNYFVNLYVYSSDSLLFCSDSVTKMVNVTVAMPECQANFIMHPDSGVNAPNLYHFHDISENNPDAWLWDFGDGQSSTDKNPTHQYEAGGAYEVSLTVTKYNIWGEDCSDTKTIAMQTPAYFHIGGFIYTGNFPINNPEPTGDTAIVYLYRYHNSNHVVSIDTSLVVENGYFHALFLLEDDYLIKFRLTNGSANAPYYFPTYFGDKMRWQNAPLISLADSSHYNINVHLAEIPNPEDGVGSVSGSVMHHSDADAQIPAEDSEILIFDSNGQAVGYVHSSDDGGFVFNNLAFGTYTLYAESTGLFTDPVTVVLSETNPALFDVQIELFGYDVTSVSENSKIQNTTLKLFPNPVHNLLTLTVSNMNQELYYRIFDYSGREILSVEMITSQGANPFCIDVGNLRKGIYFLHVFSGNNAFSETLKFVK
ncbi:MAG: PKD domain-containing protein [Bacteroidales bacterium]|nr:PKD domain-containing protein [Bacteroidales bacterium]